MDEEKQKLLALIQEVDSVLAGVDPETAAAPDALEAFDWITAITDVRKLIKDAGVL